MMKLTAAALLAACSISCTSLRSRAADAQALADLSRTWLDAARAQNWSRVAECYTDDGILLPPNMKEVTGRAAIQQMLSGFPPIVSMTNTDVEVEISGDVAFVRGRYVMKVQPPGSAPIEDVGKYLEIRKRMSDGSWKIFRDMFSSDKP